MDRVPTELPGVETRLTRQSRLRRAARLRRRFYVLTGLSTIIPGAGLLLTRMRRVGLLLVGSVGVGAFVLVVKFLDGSLRDSALRLAVSPGLLTLATVGIIVVGALWSAAILLTAGQTRPSDGHGTIVRPVFVLVCVAAVAAPLSVVGRDMTIQRSVVTEVFQPTVASGSTPIATSESKDPWDGTPRVNVLLLGSDAGTGRWGVRTDSMMVASINTKTGDTVLIGVPRNLENVPIPTENPLSTLYPNGYNCGDQCLMNGIWTLAVDHKDLFKDDPNPGLTSTRQVLEAVLGLSIQRTIVIDLSGFKSLVTAMGGVDITVRERVCVECKSDGRGGIVWTGSKQTWIEKGPQHLNGYLALWYARSRATSDDFSRMRRQRCVAGALLNQVNAAKMVQRYPQLAEVLKKNVYTDITQGELPAWVDLVGRVQSGTIRSLPITDKIVAVGNPDFAKIRSLVKTALKAKATPAKPSSSPTTGPKKGASATPSAPADDSLSSLTASC
jgi:LCP family protein required for cell wall assembly